MPYNGTNHPNEAETFRTRTIPIQGQHGVSAHVACGGHQMCALEPLIPRSIPIQEAQGLRENMFMPAPTRTIPKCYWQQVGSLVRHTGDGVDTRYHRRDEAAVELLSAGIGEERVP